MKGLTMGDMADDAFDLVIEQEIEAIELRERYSCVANEVLADDASYFIKEYKDAPDIVKNILEYYKVKGSLSRKQRDVLIQFCSSRGSYED